MSDTESEEHGMESELEELKKGLTELVATLDTAIKGLKAVSKQVKKEATIVVRVKKGVSVKLEQVLNEAEEKAVAAGVSYGTVVLNTLHGARIE
jgi:hypothetical protein